MNLRFSEYILQQTLIHYQAAVRTNLDTGAATYFCEVDLAEFTPAAPATGQRGFSHVPHAVILSCGHCTTDRQMYTCYTSNNGTHSPTGHAMGCHFSSREPVSTTI